MSETLCLSVFLLTLCIIFAYAYMSRYDDILNSVCPYFFPSLLICLAYLMCVSQVVICLTACMPVCLYICLYICMVARCRACEFVCVRLYLWLCVCDCVCVGV